MNEVFWSLLIVIILFLQGHSAQFVLTQLIYVSESPWSKVTISRKRSRETLQRPLCIGCSLTLEVPTSVVYDDDDRPSGVPGQLSGSIDSSSSSTSLTLADLLIEDEADYYCQSSGSGFSHSAQNQG